MENSKIKNILVIDNHDSFVYNLVQILRENEHCQFDIVYNDQIDFSSLGNYDKILLSPGPGIPAEAGELLTLIEHCKTTHDILGVCLGHQAIAESFGASLQQLPHPKHGHESPLTIVDSTDILYHDLTYPVQVGRYHSWIVNPHTLPPMPPYQRPRRRRSHHVLLPHNSPHPRCPISPRIHHHPPGSQND